MPTLCPNCQTIQANPFHETRHTFPHLHPFLIDEPDEFLTFVYHICPECHQLWHEWHSTYNKDYGWHWETITWAELLRRYKQELPNHLEKSTQAGLAWALARSRPFDASPPFTL